MTKSQGQEYWRSLEELAGTEEFQTPLHREFPENASNWMDPVSRRGFMKLMGASLALAGLSACTSPPDERIAPYVRPPEEIVPGKPLFLATAVPFQGFATGLLAESNMGRPTKLEGNPKHPASLGATDIFTQASVLSLYDPDRSQAITNAGRISTWNAFSAALSNELNQQRIRRGARLRILTETVTSPTLAAQLRALLSMFPAARWHQYEPAARDSARLGARLALGEFVETHCHLDKADVILALDADFLCAGPGSVRYARDFPERRKIRGRDVRMNRLYVVESTPTNTGTMADHRLALRAGEIEGFARAVAQGLGVVPGAAEMTSPGPHAKWIAAVLRDLQRHRGASLVVVGDGQPPAVHALAHAMNHALGNVGTTVIHTDSVEANLVDQRESLRELAHDIEAGRVDVLFILGGNPAFTAPADRGREAPADSRVPAARDGLDDHPARAGHGHVGLGCLGICLPVQSTG